MLTAEHTTQQHKIATAAFGLFCQKGIKSITMDDIAQHLGMSKKTIYKWFTNKDQIVYASTSSYLQATEQECEDFITNSANAIEELLQVIGMTKRVFSTLHASIFFDLQKYHRTSWELWVQHKEQFILEKIRQNIQRGITEGLYRKDLDVEVLARMRLIMIELPFNPLLFPPQDFEVTQVQLSILELYMMGMATLKGHKLINDYKHITEDE